MKLNAWILLFVFLFLFSNSHDVLAHISVGGDRNFGVIDGGSFTNAARTVRSSYGWAAATDQTWGDSHRTTQFKFTLESVQSVTITVSRRDVDGQTGAADFFLPAFSVFQTPQFLTSTHDTGTASLAYLASTGEPTKDGAFRALAPWEIYQDNVSAGRMHFDAFIGHAADGTVANYGSAPGINGDGVADGFVSFTFSNLAAGDYYIFVGGANYFPSAGELAADGYGLTYGITVSISTIPEPTALLLLGAGLVSLTAARRRKRSSP